VPEALEAIAAAASASTAFIEVVHQACVEERTGLAKALAERWQRKYGKRGFALAARRGASSQGHWRAVAARD